jgi:hypothetical protein
MNAMAPYDFSKLVNCDFIDKRIEVTTPLGHIRTSYYGDMNFFSEFEASPGIWEPSSIGTWSVENGILINDSVAFGDINKTVSNDEINQTSQELIRTITGRGTLTSIIGQLTQYPLDLTPTNIPFNMTINTLKGNRINLTYQEPGFPAITSDVFLFPNMTYSFGATGEDVGVWKIENGVLMLDSYWLNNDGVTVQTGVESWVFSDLTHAIIYTGHTADANVTINSVTAIQAGDAFPPEFTLDPVTYPFTMDMLNNKMVIIGDPLDPTNTAKQDTIFFYANMTYRHETHDNLGNPEILTGSWTIKEGAIIIDVVYSDSQSSHYIFTSNTADYSNLRFMEVVGSASVTEPSVPVISVSDIPTTNGVTLTPVIMYLLN